MARRLGTLAGIALLFICRSAVGAAASESITIGDLTFNYEPGSWRMESAGDDIVATCLHPDCRGAVVDISRRDGEDECTKETMTAEADRLFPRYGRAYVNVLRAGRFALVLAQRHVGREFSTPEFVYGCVPWQGSDYRFAMRPETVGTQAVIGGALHSLVIKATAPDPVVERVRIGEVDFHISTEFWRISVAPDGETVLLSCRAPGCREPAQLAALSSRSPPEECADPSSGLEDIGAGFSRFRTLPAGAPDGLTFTIKETWLGCRNYVPPDIEACAVHGDRSYRFTMSGGAGCRSNHWWASEEGLTELLRGARIAR